MASFFAAHNLPFAVAACLVGLIALVEAAGLLFGFSASNAIDSQIPDLDGDVFDAPVSAHEADVHASESVGPLSQVLSWLTIGRVPILILLVVFLLAFALTGFVVQGIVAAVAGAALPPLLASLPALVVAVPAVRYAGLGLARIMPKEESDAVSQSSFVGRIAVVTGGLARRGLAAEAKLKDAHGHTHYIRVEPDEDAATFAPGVEVLIVHHSGSVYRVIANPSAAMTDRPT